jgi:D-sedoheptulose 7-phosphate isomerase
MMHSERYLKQVGEIALKIDYDLLEKMVEGLFLLRENKGRLFFLGVGGSAANCGHAVNDFRKLAGFEAYAPTDNVAELTARTNDEGWDTVFAAWLRGSQANEKDAIFILSVGGGNAALNVSPNLVKALDEAKQRKLKIFGIVGRDGGYTRQVGDLVIVVPTVDPNHITPHSESFQAVLWHCLVCHPKLIIQSNKWESVSRSTEARSASNFNA